MNSPHCSVKAFADKTVSDDGTDWLDPDTLPLSIHRLAKFNLVRMCALTFNGILKICTIAFGRSGEHSSDGGSRGAADQEVAQPVQSNLVNKEVGTSTERSRKSNSGVQEPQMAERLGQVVGEQSLPAKIPKFQNSKIS